MCVSGLVGIELGNYLIKQVVKEVQTEFPLLKQYSSLSPIPGYKDWLLSELLKVEKGTKASKFSITSTNMTILSFLGTTNVASIFSEDERRSLMEHLESSKQMFWPDIRKCIAKNWWAQDVILQELLSPALVRLCAHYLYRVKRRGYVLDSVGRFRFFSPLTEDMDDGDF